MIAVLPNKVIFHNGYSSTMVTHDELQVSLNRDLVPRIQDGPLSKPGINELGP